MTCGEKTPSTTGHTPGPWDYDMDYIVAPDPNGRHPDIYIAEIAHRDDEDRIPTPEQQDANRRLIAAAPELLEKLTVVAELRRRWRSQDESETIDSVEYMDGLDALDLDAAIAKATGQDSDGRQP